MPCQSPAETRRGKEEEPVSKGAAAAAGEDRAEEHKTDRLGDAHPALSEREQAGLGADGLDVGARQVVLGEDVLLEVDVVAERHARRVQAKYVPFRLRRGKV